jgi:hypothetical protein
LEIESTLYQIERGERVRKRERMSESEGERNGWIETIAQQLL